MNIVILAGFVVKEVELKYTSGAEPKAYAKFNLAVAKDIKGSGADFITCTVWGKSAEAFAQYVAKGQKILVHGKWVTGSFEGKNGKVYTNECNVDKWEFAGASKKTDAVDSNGFDASIPADANFMNLGDNIDDEVPFN